MDLQHYFTFVAALIFVLALIMLLAWIARRLGVGGATPVLGRQRRLAVVEVLPIDAKHRLVLVRRDDTEHLIILGADGQSVVETGIRPSGFAAAVAELSAQPEQPE